MESDNFIRAVLDTNGDGSYETILFDFKGFDSNTAYRDVIVPSMGDLSTTFSTFSGIVLPAGDSILRLRIETWSNSTNNENNGFDTIVVIGTPLASAANILTFGLPGNQAVIATTSPTTGTII